MAGQRKKKGDAAGRLIERFPAILESITFRKATQDYAVTYAVDKVKVKYVKPIMDLINHFFVVMPVPVSDIREAEALLKDDEGVPSLPDPEDELEPIGGECGLSELAYLLEMTERNIQLLAKKGVIVNKGRGQYDISKSVRGYVRYLRDQAQGGGDAALVEERKGLVKAQRQKAELELAVRRGLLVEAAGMRSYMEKLFTAMKQKLLSLPTKSVPFLEPILKRGKKAKAKGVLDEHVIECLRELQGLSESGVDSGKSTKRTRSAAPSKSKSVGGRKKTAKSRK